MHAKTTRELGALIRSERTKQGETQRSLAKRVNLTQSTVSKLERGYAGLTIGTVFQILKALNLAVTLSELRGPQAMPSDADDDFDLDAIANTGLTHK